MGTTAGTLRVSPEGAQNGNGSSKKFVFFRTRAGANKSKEIDKALSKDAADDANKFKILLLGGSECGKTTIFKQMRILHLNGFTMEDQIGYRATIHKNAIDALTSLIDIGISLNLRHDIAIKEDIDRFIEFKKEIDTLEPPDIAISFSIGRTMERIWQSAGIQTVYGKRFQYKILDSAKYFLDDIIRLTEELYMPTTQDILQCRYRTNGINEISFGYKNIEFKMVDVGGQRTERRKWIHCFDNVDMVLFVASMADYDLTDPEDDRMNRMLQNHEIYKTICRTNLFKNASIVVFLNKHDIFLEKLKTSPLKKCFKGYEGDQYNDPQSATDYVSKQFSRIIKDKDKYFSFTTQATDTRNIEHVFSSAVSHIVNENLKSTGLYD